MPYPIPASGFTPTTPSTQRNPRNWPAFPDIPIFLDTGDERATARTYGTTPTTPTTPDMAPPTRPTYLSPARANIPPISPVEPSPTTTIETSSQRSSVWPIPEPPPEIQQPAEPRRPTLRFFPAQRPRVRLDGIPSMNIPSINERTPISIYQPGLGILNGPPKPPSIEISPPVNEKSDPEANIAQRIEEKLWRYSASGNILKRWLLEALSWLFSAICMVAVIGVLARLKDEPLSKWVLAEKTGLTLNAYISVLSKMAGAALILPVSEALGQLKWSWFLEHSKQMWDFEIFDNASRGPWGSLLLLIRTKGKALAALGAMIMLCSLALDPFFQQVVDFPNRWALQNESGAIPRVVYYKPPYVPEYYMGFEEQSIDQLMGPTAQKFFYGNGTQPVQYGNGTRPEIPLVCPTSNCTWPDYESLGICSKCVSMEASELLTFTCMNTTIDWSAHTSGPISDKNPLPNGTVCGYFVNATSESPILMSGYMTNETEAGTTLGEALLVRVLPLTAFLTKEQLYGAGSINFKNTRNPILDTLIVSAVNGTESVYGRREPVVHECVLSWCVQSIRSSYQWGNYDEEIVSTFENSTRGPSPWESFEIPESEGGGTYITYMQNVTIQPPRTWHGRTNNSIFDTTYGSDNISVANMMTTFDDFFPSYYTADSIEAQPTLKYKNYPMAGGKTRALMLNPWEAPNNITRHMERLASAMSNVLRSSPSRIMAPGEAYNQENYVAVRWEWLTLPLGLLFISFIFLAATVTKSALERDRVGVWKTSAYATLLYGLPDEMQTKLTRSASTGTPRSKAKELKVKLQPNGGWRISGNLFTPFTPKPKQNQPPPGWI